MAAVTTRTPLFTHYENRTVSILTNEAFDRRRGVLMCDLRESSRHSMHSSRLGDQKTTEEDAVKRRTIKSLIQMFRRETNTD